MRKFLIAAPLALAAAAALTTPASAQGYGRHGGWNGGANLRNEIAQLDRQVDHAQNRRLISNREAQRLDREVNQLQRLHAQYARNGFTNGEMRTLENRIAQVQRMVSREIRDRDGRRG